MSRLDHVPDGNQQERTHHDETPVEALRNEDAQSDKQTRQEERYPETDIPFETLIGD